MSYISAIKKRDDVYVWERTDEGRELKVYPAPYYFFTKDPEGEYVSLYGDKLRRHDFILGSEYTAARNEFEGRRIEMFESDIPPEIRILSEHYYNVPAPNLHVTFLDIEVDFNPEVGFSSPSNPYAEINSIALHHRWENRTILLITPPEEYTGTKEQFIAEMDEIEPLPNTLDPEDVIFCASEMELLLTLLVFIEDSDVICGWNSDFFDMPYIGKRIEQVLGPRYFQMLSFPEAPPPRWREIERFGVPAMMIDLRGRIRVDYLDLFRKYEAAERPSYKLESISEEVLPNMRKLEYEGSLADLYRKNFPHFGRYNIRDTEVLNGFEDTLGYVALANEMYHLSTGLMEHVPGTLKLAELATINFCHYEMGVRVPNNDIDEERESEGIEGALVLQPRVGKHEWIGSMDINSLYPSSIRSINISPEQIVGQFLEAERAQREICKQTLALLTLQYEDGRQEERSADEWHSFLKSNKWAISGYGTVFDQNKKGIIPSILESWYSKRKEYQKLAKQSKDPAEAAYYDRIQFTYKIKLNSYYGALNNQFFRFHDLRMGESTTGTGRKILAHMCASVCETLNGEYVLPRIPENREDKTPSYNNDRSVIYGDTDSSYFATHAENEEEAVLIADAVAERVNNTFPAFMREQFLVNDGFDDIIKAGREVVASSGLFVDKKRYILHVVDNEGKKCDKLKVMGLDTKKTTLPAAISKELNRFVERLLKGEDWKSIAEDIVKFKEYVRTTDDLLAIGLPKGVKKVEHYTKELQIYGAGQSLPGHVAAAIHYNQCLNQYNDKRSLMITSGMKIKVYYLTQKHGRFKSIALPTDAEFVPEWFTDNFTVDRAAHIERLVDNPLRNIIKAVGYEVPSKQSLLVDDLLEF